MATDSYKWISYKKKVLAVGGSWWVLVDIPWLMVGGGKCLWICFGWWWVVVGGVGYMVIGGGIV